MKPSCFRKYLTFKPFDTHTVHGQQQERYRRAAWSVFANIFSKILSMAVMVMSVSLTIPYLGQERFGVWMTIASFAGMLGFLDLGIGNALTNQIAKAAINDDQATLRNAISGGLGLMFLVGIGMALFLFCIASQLSWTSLIKVKDAALYDEIRVVGMWFAGLFGLNLFTTSILRVFAGLQKAYYGHLAASLGSLVALLALWQFTLQHAGITTLLIISLGTQSLAGLFLLGWLIRKKIFALKGLDKAIRCEYKILLHAGGLFFILQIGCMIGWGADSLIISSTLGAAQVAVYNVTQRLFQFVTLPLAMINSPLWAAYADAHAKHDSIFIGKTLKRSLLLTFGAAILGSTILLTFGQQIVSVWTKGDVYSPLSFISVMGALTVMESVGNGFAMFLNGCNIIKPQVILTIMFCLLTIPSKLFLVNKYGIIGVTSATILAYLLSVILMYLTFFRTTILNEIHPIIK